VSIIRRRHTANFTTIGNTLFDDDRLAADELGILVFLRSKPADWEVRRPVLMRRFRIGRDAMRRIVANWMKTGWCQAKKERRQDGTFVIVYEIRDERGNDLSEEEIRRALSPESGDAPPEIATENIASPCADAWPGPEPCGQPATCQPVLAHPSTADPYLDNKRLLNTDSPRTESNQAAAARAREPLISDLAGQLADEIMRTLGIDLEFVPPGWCGAALWLQTGLNVGWRPEIVRVAVDRVRARKSYKLPSTYRYLNQPILDEHKMAEQLPMSISSREVHHAEKTADHRASSPWQQSRDRWRVAAAELSASVAADEAREEDGGETVQTSATTRRNGS
jgi:hypothetical protein